MRLFCCSLWKHKIFVFLIIAILTAEKQMLDDFVDVTKDEKLIMHMWNSFVRKQRSVICPHYVLRYSNYHDR